MPFRAKHKGVDTHMALYEHVFLARQDVSAQQVETMTETYKGIGGIALAGP